MAKLKDLTGQRFGRLTVIGRDENYVSPEGVVITRWKCKCDCGNEKSVLRTNLKYTTSCGCYRKEHCAEYARKRWGKVG